MTRHSASFVLFLVAAGLQLVFGVQKLVNLACGSFYALGAYFGITAVGLAIKPIPGEQRILFCCARMKISPERVGWIPWGNRQAVNQ